GQAYANVNGTCVYPPYISGQQQTLRNMSQNYTVHNALPGDVFSWAITDWDGLPTNIATIIQGQGTNVLRIKLTNNVFESYPVYFQIVLTLTNANSSTRTVYYDVQLLDQIRP
ncbi:hypothetical protein, partial [Pedobacter sp. Hv1]|uniref:hypothetical protein n=1 Tax=Pedobacter sp. Hv1 TaxID=1740090 RepID=UPI000ADBDF36